MKKSGILIVFAIIMLLSCDTLNVTTLTVDGAVVYQETTSKIAGAYGIFIVAKADIEYYDRNAIPEISPPPPDTSSTFPKLDLPSFLTPESGAEVMINSSKLNEEYEGQYQGEVQDIGPGDSVSISVVTQNGDTGRVQMVMPDTFTVNMSDTVISYDSLTSLDLSWSRSENASAYMVLLYSVDTTENSVSLTFRETTEDTIFSISREDLTAGTYLLQVASIYGRLNASMPQAGTLVGVLGQVATLYIKKPILIEIQ